MNTKLLIAFLVSAAALQGCIISTHDGGGGYHPPPPVQAVAGDVQFSWSFLGGTCADVPQVKSVRITIPGQTLQNAGVYPCLVANYPGVMLYNFAPGSYDFTIEAVDYSNTVVYAGSGSFAVNGNVRVNIDLTPVGGPTSYAYLTWTFPASGGFANPTCSQAGVATVAVTIDGITTNYDCSLGQTSTGAQTPMLNAGMHNIDLVALSGGASPIPYYRYTGQLQTQNGQPVGADYFLDWNVGGAAIRWSLSNNNGGQSCSSAGITSVSVNLQDSAGNWIYGQNGDTQQCGTSYVTYDYLQPGTYTVYIVAYNGANIRYESNTANPPVVNVVAGQWQNSVNQAVNVQLATYY